MSEEYKELFDIYVDEAYLYNSLPGNGMMMYAESSNLKQSGEMLLDMYSSMEDFDEVITMLRSSLESVGLDLEENVLGFMDKGYVVAMQDLGTIIPGMSFFVDASSNPEGAKFVLGKMFEGIDDLLKDVPEDVGALISHEPGEGEGGVNFSLSLDLNNLSDEAKEDMPEDLKGLNMEFNYGINVDNIFYFALYPNIEQGGYPVLADNEEFKKALTYIEGYNKGITFIDVGTTMKYVDRFVEFGAKMEGESPSDYTEYQMVKSYIVPFKSLIMSAKDPAEGEVEIYGFVRIGAGGVVAEPVVLESGVLEELEYDEDCKASCEVMGVGVELVDECLEKCKL